MSGSYRVNGSCQLGRGFGLISLLAMVRDTEPESSKGEHANGNRGRAKYDFYMSETRHSGKGKRQSICYRQLNQPFKLNRTNSSLTLCRVRGALFDASFLKEMIVRLS